MPKAELYFTYTSEEVLKLAGLVTESENRGKTGKAKRLANTLLTERQKSIAQHFQRKFRSWYLHTGIPDTLQVSEEEKEVLDKMESICLML